MGFTEVEMGFYVKGKRGEAVEMLSWRNDRTKRDSSK